MNFRKANNSRVGQQLQISRVLNGANRYVLHFDNGGLPNAFWSLYDGQIFFVDNPINHYNIAGWMTLKYNADGLLDVYSQHDSPGDAAGFKLKGNAMSSFTPKCPRLFPPTDMRPCAVNAYRNGMRIVWIIRF